MLGYMPCFKLSIELSIERLKNVIMFTYVVKEKHGNYKVLKATYLKLKRENVISHQFTSKTKENTP